MMLLDVNVLVQVHREDADLHSDMTAWLERALVEPVGVAVSELVLSGFLRVVTHPKIFRDPSPLAVAMEFVEDLRTIGHCVSDRAVAALLKKGGSSIQAMRKTKEGGTHEHRDARFANIAAKVNAYQAGGQPVVSIDAKKKELVGTFASKGREWQPKGQPEEANVYDFIDKILGKVTPYGIYDVVRNEGWVSVGIDHDTAKFAVESLRRWWRETGCALYPKAGRLLVTADGGGSNGSRVRLWKLSLQRFTEESGLETGVCHYPPGTSKWNKIEHRMFNHISMNWRGRALATREIIVSLIGETKSKSGLKIRAALDEGIYPTGGKVGDQEMSQIKLARTEFQPAWNYKISPK